MASTRTPALTSMTHEVMSVTPALAREWLATNTHNRHMRYRAVEAYARDMAEGNWALNGEAIKFGADGTLLDGQHRLAAIVKADTTVAMLVVRGLFGSVQDTLDCGVGRRFADQLQLAGEPAPQILSALLRKIVLWEVGCYMNNGGNLKPTFAELADTLKAHPQARDCAVYGTKRAVGSSLHASTIGFLYWLLSRIDYADAAWFLDRISDGVGLAAGHPALVLRERIRRERDTNNGKLNPDVILALAILAWNAHRGRRTLQKLQLPKDGLTNSTFPQPRK